jgi:acyl carrier protein
MQGPSLVEFIEIVKRVTEIPDFIEVTKKSQIEDLGIDSIRMIILVNEIDKKYNVILEVRSFFEAGTIEDLHSILIKKIN